VDVLALAGLEGLGDLLVGDRLLLELADLLVADRAVVLAVDEVELQLVLGDGAEQTHRHIDQAEGDRAAPEGSRRHGGLLAGVFHRQTHLRRAARRSRARAVIQSPQAASTAAGTASSPLVPTSSEANSVDVISRRVLAAIPAAAPTATASVGETSNQTWASSASAMPRKIAGNTGPPRKPQPRQIPYPAALATRTMRTIFVESAAASDGTPAWPEKRTSCEFAPSQSAVWAMRPTASPPPTRRVGRLSR